MSRKRNYRCIIKNCGYNSESSVGTFCFPTSSLDVRENWAKAAQISLENVLPSFRICYQHFDEELDFYPMSKKIRPNAVPSKNLVSSFTTRFLVLLKSNFKFWCIHSWKSNIRAVRVVIELGTVFENHSKSLFVWSFT